MMNFDDFCQSVKKDVVHYLPPQYREAEVRLQTNRKVNLGEMVGVTFTMPGTFVGPIVYLKDYYSAVSMGGLSMEHALARIGNQAAEALGDLKHSPVTISDLGKLSSWDEVKDHVRLSAVGYRRNEELLSTVPHREMGDIACTYRIELRVPGGADGSVLINNKNMEMFGVDEQELFAAGVANMLRDNKPTLNRMSDVVGTFMPGGIPSEDQKERLERTNLLREDVKMPGDSPEEADRYPEDEEDFDIDYEVPLFVLTTQSMVQGAAAVFIPSVLEEISRKMPEGFYVLPSSVHEVMVLPKGPVSSIRQLDDMVNTINETQVSPEDQLSDFAHVYDADRKILLCPGAPELNLERDKEPEQGLSF